MQVTTTTRSIARPGRGVRIIPWILTLVGLGLLVGAGFAARSELSFRGIAVETDGRVVRMIAETDRSNGRTSRTYRPVFAFNLPDGKEIRAEGGVASNPPCCSVGDRVRVRYDPANPSRAQMTGFMESWLVTAILGGIGIIFTGAGLAVRRVVSRFAVTQGVAGAPVPRGNVMTFAVPLAGLRRDMTPQGMRWTLQARWQDPRSGVQRLFEGPPLPFDPVPQMRQMSAVNIQFDPGDPNGPYAMDLSFLVPPAGGGDAATVVGPIRRG